ncbi:MAG: hypothetical protein WA843_04535 [Candidatus Saccharimonadales bacterium]
MSEHRDPDQYTNEAVFFEFNTRDSIAQRRSVEIYEGSGVAWWSRVRSERYAELIEPQLMYATPDLGHRVVWVKHAGLIEDRDEKPEPYVTYHVVCDCAVEAEQDPHPSSSLYCEYVDNVLNQRAQELAARHRLPETLGTLTTFDEETFDLRLTHLGQELAIRAIASLLEVDKKHPKTWAANRVNGLHEIDILGVFINQAAKEVMPLLELMEQGKIVEIDGDKVKLAPQQLGKI